MYKVPSMIIGMGSGHVLLIKIEIEECNNASIKHFNFLSKVLHTS